MDGRARTLGACLTNCSCGAWLPRERRALAHQLVRVGLHTGVQPAHLLSPAVERTRQEAGRLWLAGDTFEHIKQLWASREEPQLEHRRMEQATRQAGRQAGR